METSRFDTLASNLANNQAVNDTQKAILDTLVKVLVEVDKNNQQIQKLQTQLVNYQSTLRKYQSILSDVYVLANNNDINNKDVINQLQTISNKIDNVDIDVKNIKVYRTINNGI